MAAYWGQHLSHAAEMTTSINAKEEIGWTPPCSFLESLV